MSVNCGIKSYSNSDMFHILVKDCAGNIRAEWIWDGRSSAEVIARDILGPEAEESKVKALAVWIADNEEPTERYELAPLFYVVIHEIPSL